MRTYHQNINVFATSVPPHYDCHACDKCIGSAPYCIKVAFQEGPEPSDFIFHKECFAALCETSDGDKMLSVQHVLDLCSDKNAKFGANAKNSVGRALKSLDVISYWQPIDAEPETDDFDLDSIEQAVDLIAEQVAEIRRTLAKLAAKTR